MPPIRDLNGPRKRFARGFGIDTAAVPTHDLGARMRAQPPCDGVGIAVRQQVDHLALLKIAQDRAVAMPLLPCPVIDAKHARRCHRQSSSTMLEFTEQSRSADQQP
jgi:hypothetical protein